MTLHIKFVDQTALKMKYGKQLVVFALLTITKSMESVKTAQEIQFMSPVLRLAENLAQTDKFGWWINANVSLEAILWMEVAKFALNGLDMMHQLRSANQFVS